jgi:hypothetical protein
LRRAFFRRLNTLLRRPYQRTHSLNALIERLDPWPTDVPVAVEVRNKAWMTAALGHCLRRHNAVWVLPDQVWMRSQLSVVDYEAVGATGDVTLRKQQWPRGRLQRPR